MNEHDCSDKNDVCNLSVSHSTEVKQQALQAVLPHSPACSFSKQPLLLVAVCALPSAMGMAQPSPLVTCQYPGIHVS